MASQSSNSAGAAHPFGIPGLQLPGADGNVANPVLQSMEMMRQVWSTLGTLSQTTPVSPAMGLDELDRRITDLRAVENWLNLNLTMLRGTIQGLEVQRATISTLRSFAQTASEAYGAGAQDAPPSPLEVALGLRRPPEAAKPKAPDGPGAGPEGVETAPPGAAGASDLPSSAKPAEPPAAAGLWWNMLQEQFGRMAAAAASMPGAPAPAPKANAKAASKPASPRKATAKPAGTATRRTRPSKA